VHISGGGARGIAAEPSRADIPAQGWGDLGGGSHKTKETEEGWKRKAKRGGGGRFNNNQEDPGRCTK